MSRRSARATSSAVCAAPSRSGCRCCSAATWPRPGAGSRAPAASSRRPATTASSAASLLVPQALQALMSGDPATAFATFEQVAAIGERFGDHDLLTLSRLGRGQSLIAMSDTRPRRAAARRGDGGGPRRRDLADRLGHRLLRGHRGLLLAVRPPPRAGMDRRPRPLVRIAAGPRPVPRQLPRLPSRADALPRDVAGRGRRGATCPGVAVEAATRPGCRRGALPAGRAGSPARRVRVGRGGLPRGELVGVAGRSPGLRCSGLRRAMSTRRPHRSGERWPRRPTTSFARGCSSRRWRSRWRPATWRGARAAADELGRLADAFDAPLLRAMAARCDGSVRLAAGEVDGARSASSVERGRHGGNSTRRTRRRGSGSPIGRACRELGDRDGAALEFEAAREVFERLGAAPDLDRLARESGERVADDRRPEPSRGRDPASGRGREDEPGDRGGAVDQRADRRPARQQHLHQARLVDARGRDRLRLRARPRLIPARYPCVVRERIGYVGPMRRATAQP